MRSWGCCNLCVWRAVFGLIFFAVNVAPLVAQTFTNVSKESGLVARASWAGAWADYDRDGDLDLVTLGHHKPGTKLLSQLWRNRGDGTFEEATAKVFRTPFANADTHGVAWCDLDGDGHVDIFIAQESSKDFHDETIRRSNEMWRNNGDGTFTDVTAGAGITGEGRCGRGAAAADYDNDGDLDVMVTGGDHRRMDTDCNRNFFYHQLGGLRFEDRARETGLLGLDQKNFVGAWGDYNGDGRPDLLVTAPSCLMLFSNKGDGTFQDTTATAGIGSAANSTSVAWADYDNDGHMDFYLTRTRRILKGGDTKGILFRNKGDGTFLDVTAESRLINEVEAYGVAWGDYDNDGFLDLCLASGFSAANANPNRLFRNKGNGTFQDVTAATHVEAAMLEGAAADVTFVDYNNDGFQDLFLTTGRGNGTTPVALLRNGGNRNHWIKLALEGVKSNRDGLGAKIRLTSGGKTQYREHNGPAHYLSQDRMPIHFGLGQADLVSEITIQWPSGIKQTLTDIRGDQTLIIRETGLAPI